MIIKDNKLTGGYSAVIEKEGEYYLADISYTLDKGAECMIFRSDKNGKVDSWEEVYVEWPDTVTKDNLKKCIKEFLEM